MSDHTDPHAAPDPHAALQAPDPIHDIDGRKTVIWLVVWGLGLIVAIWVMTQLFYYLVFNERLAKNNVKDAYAEKLVTAEQNELDGKDGNKSIQQAIDEYLR